jgi:carboxypeptidase C (cathepsin A)
MHQRCHPLLGTSLVLLFAFSAAAPGLAAEKATEGAEAKAAPPAPPPPFKSVTSQRLATPQGELRYSVTAEEIYLRDAEDKPTASFFTISYALDGVKDKDQRPLTFIFNGGPGSSSIWLHLGLVGPRIIDVPSDASSPAGPPYKLRDNPHTLLRATDLVFVDPVGTGFSKALGEKKNEDFWGFDQDADSVAEFIRTFIGQHGRWNSPKFVLGESYGGIRSSLLVPRLQQDMHIHLNGVILISPAINMLTLPFVVAGNDLPNATHLPALAATAYYHHKLPDSWPDLKTLLAEVEAYAGGEYLQALFRGDTLSPEERRKVAQRLHRYTGLSETYVLRSDLRIFAQRFIKELLREEGKAVALLDGRYLQDELDDVAAFPDGNPFDARTSPVYLPLFHTYLKNDLGVDWNRPFKSINLEANGKWKRPQDDGAFAGFVDVTVGLAQGTRDNDHLRIFAGSGYHDLTTSYFATRYMLQHGGIDRERLTIKDYEGGHMMYLFQPSLEALSNDLLKFIEAR